MTPILLTTLLTQMKWTICIVQPKITLRMVSLAGVFLGLLFYLLIPLIRLWWQHLPIILSG